MTAGREKAMREPLARVEKAHGSFVLFIGTTPLECWDIKHNAEVTRDFVNDFAESWYQSRSRPLVEALEAIIKHYEIIAGLGMTPRSTVVSIAKKALEAHNG